ncbi:MAG: phenylalanine--tRNA ligase subunit beta, partial [Candidatus Peregrinibacteria bacterium]|nr:phenylalanine--tRNA ligase subunit beta [Candidatus Peregrinibacteria bacterium]
MKLSLNWLSEFVDLKNLKTEEVGEKLTIHTSELEEIISEKEFFQDVFAGKMLDTRSHKDSDKLSVATFDLGKNGKKQIIYAKKHEVKVGEILPISIAGAKLKSGIEINNSEIRGEKSEGMIADNEELGMKNEGLMFFTDKDVGKSLPEICTEFADSLFDIDNKSLTHRPDLMGHRGFALELSAIWKRKLTLPEPVVAIPQDANKIPVEIKTDTCRRFCALKMENVEVKPSDLKTQSRLENLDVRAISNFVDITNWVMLEFGQPMHVFDADKLEGRIIVRQAKKGETLVALDDEEYELDETMTVVADDKKVLSIAGIMGGKESGVTETTTNIIFEAANWDPTATRKTSQKLGLRSESSMRYEKSLDPENCKRAILAATELAEKSCPQAQITSSLTDEYPIKSTPTIIKFNPEIVRKISGIDISDKEIKENLEAVNFIVNEDWSVEVPSNRATKDVSIPEDLVEEI